MPLDICRSGICKKGLKQSSQIRESFRDIPIEEFTFTQDESRPVIKIPRGRKAAEDEAYLIAMKAVVAGDLPRLKAAISMGINLHAVYNDATTLLNEAAAQGRPSILKELLDRADPNVKDCNPYGPCAPLYWAARYSRLEAVRMLLEAGATIDTTAKTNEWALTAVLTACVTIEQDQFDCLGILLQAGADINLRKSNGETLLEQAIQFERHDLMEILIKSGADMRGSLTIAATYANLDTLKLLIDRGARDEPGHPALLSAITAKKTKLVNELLHYVSKPYSTALRQRINAISEAKEEGPLNALLRVRGFAIKPKEHKPFGEMVPTSGENLTGYGARLIGFSFSDGRNVSFVAQHKRKQRRVNIKDEQDYGTLRADQGPVPLADQAEFSFQEPSGPDPEAAQSFDHDSINCRATEIPRLTEASLAAYSGDLVRKRGCPASSIASTAAFSEDILTKLDADDPMEIPNEKAEPNIPTNDDFDPGFWDNLRLSQLP